MSAILALSGGYGGADASRIVTVSDVVVSIGEAEYPLDVSLRSARRPPPRAARSTLP